MMDNLAVRATPGHIYSVGLKTGKKPGWLVRSCGHTVYQVFPVAADSEVTLFLHNLCRCESKEVFTVYFKKPPSPTRTAPPSTQGGEPC